MAILKWEYDGGRDRKLWRLDARNFLFYKHFFLHSILVKFSGKCQVVKIAT